MTSQILKFNVSSRHLEQCCGHITERLRALQLSNALHHSLFSHDEGTSRFQVLEFYGDSILHYRITCYLMRTRRFLTPHLLTQIRTSITSNANLAHCFTILNLHSFVSFAPPTPGAREPKSEGKTRADVMEAIIGELTELIEQPSNQKILCSSISQLSLQSPQASPSLEIFSNFNPQQQQQQNHSRENLSISQMASEVLEDILALASYTGEQHYFSTLAAGEAASLSQQQHQLMQQHISFTPVNTPPPPPPPPSLQLMHGFNNNQQQQQGGSGTDDNYGSSGGEQQQQQQQLRQQSNLAHSQQGHSSKATTTRLTRKQEKLQEKHQTARSSSTSPVPSHKYSQQSHENYQQTPPHKQQTQHQQISISQRPIRRFSMPQTIQQQQQQQQQDQTIQTVPSMVVPILLTPSSFFL